jgi:hypothetical protein
VERATAKEPAARFESPMALLRELSQEPPLPAPPPRAPRPHVTEIVKRTLQVAVGLAAIGVVAGALANRTFNFVIARPPSFDATSFAAQVWLGMRSLILPTLIFAVMTVASSLLQLAFRLPILRRLSAVVPWQRLIGMAGKAEEEAATVLARFVVAAGFGVLVVLWFIFSDIVYGFTNIISVDSLERFAPWREQSDLRTIRYRVSYTAALFLMAAGWRAVRRIRLSTGGRTPGSIRAAGIAVAGISIAFLAAPHKLSVQNDMPVALVAGQRCYLLGERRAAGDASEVPQSLLYCPAWSVPRVRTLTGTVDMTSCGFEENVFLLSTATDCTPMAEP